MEASWVVLLVLLAVVAVILWRPRGINEALPAAVGALTIYGLGFVDSTDLNSVLHVVSGAGLTIVATILMSSVLERAGFFRWAAFQIAHKAQGSGKVLFFLTLLLSFFMTIFFNNDGSILITTPIILEITQRLRFNKKQSLPYLLGGALIATASSAPIGVSNLANLIALASVGLDLNQYAELMLIPSLLGIGVCAALLYGVPPQHSSPIPIE
jgi:arsenical pump membrane protein